MSKCKIMFVDGEERVLSGLRRILRPLHEEWDICFASSGEEALAAAAATEFDLIVSEIRMPGMDGVSLLDEVRERHPDVVRIILSGYSEQMDTLRATGVAHQYVAKPCEAGLLKETVDRSSSLRRDLHNPQLLAAVTRTKSLPSPPALYAQLKQELASQDPSLARVGDIVARDPAMSAKILQIVNSAFFGLRRRVADIRHAVSLLGIDTIMALVLTTHLFQQQRFPASQQAVLDQLWMRSLSVAQLARALMAKNGSRALAEEAFLAGLLHDCGKLVFAANWPAEFVRVEREGGDRATEQAAFSADHAFVGAYLLALWGLPDDIVEAVAYHHEPSQSQNRSFSALTAVHVAHVLDDGAAPGARPEFDATYLAATGLGDQVDEWLGVAADVEYERANR